MTSNNVKNYKNCKGLFGELEINPPKKPQIHKLPAGQLTYLEETVGIVEFDDVVNGNQR
jgi:hypothetical protein